MRALGFILLFLSGAALAQTPPLPISQMQQAASVQEDDYFPLIQPLAEVPTPTLCTTPYCNMKATAAQIATLVGSGVNWAGDLLGSTSTSQTIAAGAVTLGKMANLPGLTIICSPTGSPAQAQYCTVAQIKTLLDYQFSDLVGSVGCGQLPSFTGDVNNSGCATSVVKVNNAVVPASAAVLATNSARQFIAATSAVIYNGALVSGDCPEFSGTSGIIVDSGAPCGTGSGSGTVDSGTTGQLAIYPGSGTTVGGQTASGACTISASGIITCLTPQYIETSNFAPSLSDCVSGSCEYYWNTASTGTATIPANSSVPFPISTCIRFTVEPAGGTLTVAITSDDMWWYDLNGSRQMGAYATAVACKETSTSWTFLGTLIN